MIRKADIKDINILRDILRTAHAPVTEKFNITLENCPKNPAFCNSDRIMEDYNKGLEYYILEIENRHIGCVAFEKADDDTAYLQRLAVLPEYQNTGYGKKLVRHILDLSKNRNISLVSIAIISEHTKLKQWYMKFGFVQKSTRNFDHLPFTVAFMHLYLKAN